MGQAAIFIKFANYEQLHTIKQGSHDGVYMEVYGIDFFTTDGLFLSFFSNRNSLFLHLGLLDTKLKISRWLLENLSSFSLFPVKFAEGT